MVAAHTSSDDEDAFDMSMEMRAPAGSAGESSTSSGEGPAEEVDWSLLGV